MYLKIMKFLNKWILPIIVAVILWFGIHPWAGIAAVILWIAYRIFMAREKLFVMFGQMAHIKSNLDKSIEYYRKAYDKDPENLKNALTYGYLLLKAGKADEAAEIIEPYADGDFNNDETLMARINLSLIRWKQGRREEAISILEVLHARGYESSVTHGNLGFFYIEMGEDMENEAYKECRDAYTYNNDDYSIIENYARINHIVGKMDLAADLFEKLLKKKPVYPDPWYNAGLFYKDFGDNKKAKECFEKALSFNFTYLTSCERSDVEKALASVRKC